MKSSLHLHATFGGETIVGEAGGTRVVIDGSREVCGRLLGLAAAGCYVNTLFAEAVRRGIWLGSVEVDVEIERVERPARAHNVALRVRVEADADEPTIMELVEYADRASEVANSLRVGVAVRVADAMCTARRLD